MMGLAIPAVGGILVSLVIRYLNRGKRGHGVADVMEQVELREGYVTGKAAWLAPLNASVYSGRATPRVRKARSYTRGPD